VKTCDILVVGGRVVDLTSGSGVRDDVAIAVTNGTIAAVGPKDSMEQRWSGLRRIDATGCIVTPGFVEGHVHLSAYLGAGRPYAASSGPGVFSGAGRTAEIIPMIVRLCSMPVPAELVAAVVRPVLVAMLRCGITSVVDAGSSGLDGLVAAATDVGIRAAIGPSLADMWHDEHGVLDRRADPDVLLAGARDWISAHDNTAGGRVRSVVSGVETIACSDELLAGIAQLARELDVPSQIHTHISARSVHDHVAAFGCTPTDRLIAAGFLNERCTAMHCGHLTASDVAVFASHGVTVNHNPLGNSMLGFGTASDRSIPALLAASVPIVLGSDCAPSMIATPFDMMRAALMIHRELAAADNAVTLEQVLAMATNPGVSMGQPDRLGRIEAGHRAMSKRSS
jgi:cytosine/adenosine deaminase-related metal-dependent hydrolase